MPIELQPYLTIIDGLLAEPFPEAGYHLAVLRESQDFWTPTWLGERAAAEEEFEAERARLAAALTDRWGAPRAVDLFPYLGLDECLGLDEPDSCVEPPEPLDSLCQVAGLMEVWRVPSTDRWLGLAIGQADTEFPLELLVAVAEVSSLPA